MFNMQKIGNHISSLRKKQNMTQLELADRLGISYQAVSNWERGNSMPDISKLPELADIFEISLDELLGEKSVVVEAVVNNNIAECIENNNVSEEEVKDVMPLLKPEQVSEFVEKTNVNNSYSINTFLPYMSEDAVKEFAIKAMERGEALNMYLPFMHEDDVKELAMKAKERGEAINIYLPFMFEDDVKELAIKAEERGEEIKEYLPFMHENDVKELAMKAMEISR